MKASLNTHATALAAFTLVEVVVSLALGALLLCAVLSLVVRSQLVHDQLTRTVRVAEQRTLPLKLLADDLRTRPPGANVTLVDGTLQFDTLNSLANDRLVARQSTQVQYRTQPDEHGKERVVRREAERGEFDSTATPPIPLGSPIDRFSLTLFDGRVWQSTRHPQDGWPVVAVAVELEPLESAEVIRRVFPLAAPHWRHHQER